MVSRYVSSDIQFHPINLDHFNKGKDLELCAIKIGLPQKNLIIICIYRSPTGNFKFFIKQWYINNLWPHSLQHPSHLRWLQHITPKPTVHSRVRRKQHNNCLDITIQKTPTNWKTAIYRKPTFTDTIIPYTSNHPTQHKYAEVKFLYNRLNTYDLLADEYQQDDTIHNILYNNSFPIRPQKPHHPKLKEQKQSTHTHTHTHTNGPH